MPTEIFQTENMIDLTPFSRLIAVFSITAVSSDNWRGIGVGTSHLAAGENNGTVLYQNPYCCNVAIQKTSGVNSNAHEVILDVSSISGNYYVSIVTGQQTGLCSQVRLE